MLFMLRASELKGIPLGTTEIFELAADVTQTCRLAYLMSGASGTMLEVYLKISVVHTQTIGINFHSRNNASQPMHARSLC